MWHLDGLKRALRESNSDVLFIGPGVNMKYAIGFSPVLDERPCYLAIAHGGVGLLVPALNQLQFQNALSGAGESLRQFVYDDADGPAEAESELLYVLGVRKVKRWLVDPLLPARFVVPLARRFEGGELQDGGQMLAVERRVKDAEEARLLAAAAALADEAMRAAFAALRPELSEQEVAAVIRAAFERGGAKQVDFAIVAAGADGAEPHHLSSAEKIGRGRPIVLDIGCTLDEYASDMTRMACVGEPDDAEYPRVHATVERAVEAALDVIAPGATAARVDQAARRVISAAGYGARFTHRTGHGIGLETHEEPYIHGANEERLATGMFFSVEPGIYLPGRFGVRLEEIVQVTEHGAQVLSGLSRDLYRA